MDELSIFVSYSSYAKAYKVNQDQIGKSLEMCTSYERKRGVGMVQKTLKKKQKTKKKERKKRRNQTMA